ncbi:MAG TPA: thiamine-phosphate kinase [Thermodesulfobacteriota bacterium]|jgi:thiamine-monophosphate kinase
MIDELSALERIRARFQKVSNSVFLGIGDDTAAVKVHPERLLLATTDSQVEDVHFIKKLISATDLARRSVAVSVSDIGAMGGIAKYFLASMGLSSQEDEAFLEELMDGFESGAKEFGLELVGGNLSSSNKIFIDITVLGEVEPQLIVKRNGAKPGDFLYVSGTLGDSALGHKLLASSKIAESDEYLIMRHKRPQPRLNLGRELAKKRLVSSMIDISDGLMLDLERISIRQGLGATIYVDRIPLSSNYKERISDFSRDIYSIALSGGEDYELLFSSAENKREEIKKVSKRLNIKITEIGKVTDKPPVRVLDRYETELKVRRKGFIHFL